ncbi:hypothetical protein F4821DRAFT_281822 [Hypoxylon rubiginosum]|uniref:Uncharacterized protein n=1 Tax=Hypoxylon rubiginosum TaxID=110542 RepID=A0ACC0CPW9_9PEZI|nr:hypothetical protein F4821DRAFT_281822 [Hypoxylon rubiginosum]
MDSLRSPRDQRFTIAYILNPPGHAPLLPPFRMLVPLLSRNAVATSNLARRRQQRAIRSQQEHLALIASIQAAKSHQTSSVHSLQRLRPPMNHPIHMIGEFRELRSGIVELLVYRRVMLPDGRVTIRTSWEKEMTTQLQDEKAVLAYWNSLGGRDAALGFRYYHYVFKVLAVNRKWRMLLIQWVGYPPSPPHITWEPYDKVKKSMPHLFA